MTESIKFDLKIVKSMLEIIENNGYSIDVEKLYEKTAEYNFNSVDNRIIKEYIDILKDKNCITYGKKGNFLTNNDRIDIIDNNEIVLIGEGIKTIAFLNNKKVQEKLKNMPMSVDYIKQTNDTNLIDCLMSCSCLNILYN